MIRFLLALLLCIVVVFGAPARARSRATSRPVRYDRPRSVLSSPSSSTPSWTSRARGWASSAINRGTSAVSNAYNRIRGRTSSSPSPSSPSSSSTPSWASRAGNAINRGRDAVSNLYNRIRDPSSSPQQGPTQRPLWRRALSALNPISSAQAAEFKVPSQPVDLGKLKSLQDARKSPGSLYFKAGAKIDVDGSGPHYGDKYAQKQTNVKMSNGQYLNADKTPFFVLPPAAMKTSGAKPGDLGIIRYNGKEVPAIFGDVGPRNKIGELSRRAALELGIPASPVSGGVNSGVEYQVFPGSGKRSPSPDEVSLEALRQRVQALPQPQ